MITRRFKGKTLDQCLDQVKHVFGDNAVVLEARSLKTGFLRSEVEVVATYKRHGVMPYLASPGRNLSFLKEEEGGDKGIVDLDKPSQIKKACQPSGRVIYDFENSSLKDSNGNKIPRIIEEINGRGLFAQKKRETRKKEVLIYPSIEKRYGALFKKTGLEIFLGASAAGKTLFVAKLASRLALEEGLNIALLSLRNSEEGQRKLEDLSKALKVPHYVSEDFYLKESSISKLRKSSTVILADVGHLDELVDAYGKSRNLRRMLSRHHTHWVSKFSDSSDIFQTEGSRVSLKNVLKSVVLTHTEFSSNSSNLKESATRFGLPVMYLSRGTFIAEGITEADSSDFAL